MFPSRDLHARVLQRQGARRRRGAAADPRRGQGARRGRAIAAGEPVAALPPCLGAFSWQPARRARWPCAARTCAPRARPRPRRLPADRRGPADHLPGAGQLRPLGAARRAPARLPILQHRARAQDRRGPQEGAGDARPPAADVDSVNRSCSPSPRFLVTPRTSYASRPPAEFRPIKRTRWHVLWERQGTRKPREILAEGEAPGRCWIADRGRPAAGPQPGRGVRASSAGGRPVGRGAGRGPAPSWPAAAARGRCRWAQGSGTSRCATSATFPCA